MKLAAIASAFTAKPAPGPGGAGKTASENEAGSFSRLAGGGEGMADPLRQQPEGVGQLPEGRSTVNPPAGNGIQVLAEEPAAEADAVTDLFGDDPEGLADPAARDRDGIVSPEKMSDDLAGGMASAAEAPAAIALAPTPPAPAPGAAARNEAVQVAGIGAGSVLAGRLAATGEGGPAGQGVAMRKPGMAAVAARSGEAGLPSGGKPAFAAAAGASMSPAGPAGPPTLGNGAALPASGNPGGLTPPPAAAEASARQLASAGDPVDGSVRHTARADLAAAERGMGVRVVAGGGDAVGRPGPVAIGQFWQMVSTAAGPAIVNATPGAMQASQPGPAFQTPAQPATLQVDLHPRSLGAVSVAITRSGNAVTIQVVTQTRQAEQLLKADAPNLLEALRSVDGKIDDVTIRVTAANDSSATAQRTVRDGEREGLSGQSFPGAQDERESAASDRGGEGGGESDDRRANAATGSVADAAEARESAGRIGLYL